MKATNESNMIDPESTIEIHVECNENDSENQNDGAILNKRDSIESDPDKVVVPLLPSINRAGKDLKSTG